MSNEIQLDSLMKKMASDHRAELPSANLIWWRAQILRKQEEKRRIERPMMIMRLLAAVVCAAVFLIALAANWQQVHSPAEGSSRVLFLGMIVAMVLSLVSAAVLLWSPAKE